MRDYEQELRNRIAFIKELLAESGAAGIVYGNSGGKDSVLVGALCKKACDNTIGIIMPCQSSVNFGQDMEDGLEVAKQYNIETRIVDISGVKAALTEALAGTTELSQIALTNMAPRLRMATLYAIAASENLMVAGTGNRSEVFMGYFTKWGDGGYDFNPIYDLTVTEVYEFLKYLDAPYSVIEKAPSAGLFEGQTDEDDMGVSYDAIDRYLETGQATEKDLEIITRYHKRSEHKRRMPATYKSFLSE
ncbi:MAG: NAD(+) synthase [Anaerovoracaceae bacterium]|jgi:NAD+ synthase